MVRVYALRLGTVAGLLLVQSACGGAAPEPAPAPVAAAPALDAEALAGLARQIRLRPAEADAVLAGAGLTRPAFEALLFEVAADPEASRTYIEHLR